MGCIYFNTVMGCIYFISYLYLCRCIEKMVIVSGSNWLDPGHDDTNWLVPGAPGAPGAPGCLLSCFTSTVTRIWGRYTLQLYPYT